MARREPAVLCHDRPRCGWAALAAIEGRAEVAHQDLHERGDRDGVLDGRLRIHDADLHGAPARMRTRVPPQARMVGHRAGQAQRLQLAREVVVVGEGRREPTAGHGLEHDRAGRGHAAVVASPERARGGRRQQQGQERHEPLQHGDGLVGTGERYVHVQAAAQAPTHGIAQLGGELAVAVTPRQRLVFGDGERVSASRDRAHAVQAGGADHARPEVDQLRQQLRARPRGCRRDLELSPHQLGLHAIW